MTVRLENYPDHMSPSRKEQASQPKLKEIIMNWKTVFANKCIQVETIFLGSAFLVLGVVLLLMTGLAHAESREEDWGFFMPGQYRDIDVSINLGGRWLALAPVDGLWHLVPTKVVTQLVHDPVLDSEGQKTGIQISAKEPNALALIKMPGLRPGKVDTPNMRFHGNPRDITPSKGVTIPFKGVAHQVIIVRGKLFLVRGLKRSKLDWLRLTRDFSERARLLWAGDLDGDGRLDLLVDYYERSDYTGACLFLSSSAEDGALLGRVVCHGDGGC
jgi:hypothetical protein